MSNVCVQAVTPAVLWVIERSKFQCALVEGRRRLHFQVTNPGLGFQVQGVYQFLGF
jgi:hypothetical protein